METRAETMNVKGVQVKVDSIRIDNQTILIAGRIIKIANLKEEWYEDIGSVDSIVKQLKDSALRPDIFTFWQRLPETEPKFTYRMELDNVAALRITTYQDWWQKQLSSKTRNLIRRAEKKGVEVRTVPFDEELVRGIMSIFDETPIRQGKLFWHYKKDFETVREEMSDRLEKAEFIGAYYNDKLIGFIKLLYADKYADMVEILSKIEHRDKSPTNALLAKAVEICEKKGLPHLVYAHWSKGTLGDFKRHNGFERVDLPRYYVPITAKGALCLKLNLHRGIAEMIPEKMRARLIDLRRKWYSRKTEMVNRQDIE